MDEGICTRQLMIRKVARGDHGREGREVNPLLNEVAVREVEENGGAGGTGGGGGGRGDGGDGGDGGNGGNGGPGDGEGLEIGEREAACHSFAGYCWRVCRRWRTRPDIDTAPLAAAASSAAAATLPLILSLTLPSYRARDPRASLVHGTTRTC
jgi:hypothetical protein